MFIQFPLFFIIAALIKILIGGKLIELSVKYISRMLGIKAIIIAPDKPLIIVKHQLGIKKVIIAPDKPIIIIKKKMKP
jgi:ERCC4-related helicase